jgi:hypothetical protein
MATCKYCNKPAGFLRFTHKDCTTKFNNGKAEITSTALSAIQNNTDLNDLNRSIERIGSDSFISLTEQKSLIVSAWEKAVDNFLDDGILDRSEETRLVQYKNHFLLNDSDLDSNGHLTKTAKAAVIRELAEGKIPERVSLDGSISLNLQKGEKIIWAFPNTEYLEDKTKRAFVGRSAGVSVRIMKGVYYRESAFRGHPVEYTERVSLGRGLLVLTNKHMYFHSPTKSFRVQFQKIVSFEPYSNGIGFSRDSANAKPQIFINGDGWFIYNIVSNVANLA